MRHRDITAPNTHPYIATIRIDPVDFHTLRRRIDDSPELRLLDYDDRKPDFWTLRIGCASRALVDKVEDAWG